MDTIRLTDRENSLYRTKFVYIGLTPELLLMDSWSTFSCMFLEAQHVVSLLMFSDTPVKRNSSHDVTLIQRTDYSWRHTFFVLLILLLLLLWLQRVCLEYINLIYALQLSWNFVVMLFLTFSHFLVLFKCLNKLENFLENKGQLIADVMNFFDLSYAMCHCRF